jgi:hypothetical protein
MPGSVDRNQKIEGRMTFYLECKNLHIVWKMVRGKLSWGYRMIWDARRRCQRQTGILAAPIHLPNDERQLLLVVSRPGIGRKPWYLIPAEPVHTVSTGGKRALIQFM